MFSSETILELIKMYLWNCCPVELWTSQGLDFLQNWIPPEFPCIWHCPTYFACSKAPQNQRKRKRSIALCWHSHIWQLVWHVQLCYVCAKHLLKLKPKCPILFSSDQLTLSHISGESFICLEAYARWDFFRIDGRINCLMSLENGLCCHVLLKFKGLSWAPKFWSQSPQHILIL